MSRKIFVSYSHRLDQKAAGKFRDFYSDKRDIFIDKSIRYDIGENADETIKKDLRLLIKDSSVSIILIGAETGGRWWVDWEIYNSLRENFGNRPNGLLGIRIPNKQHWVPERLQDNIPNMGHIIDWPSNYKTLVNEIEKVYEKRENERDLSRPLRVKNSSKR